MKKYLFTTSILAIILSGTHQLSAQVSISNDNSNADNSAMLDVKSNSKGVVLPRMTFEQRNAIPNPVEGLMVYCTNCNSDGTGVLSMFQGGIWQNVLVGCTAPNPHLLETMYRLLPRLYGIGVTFLLPKVINGIR